MRHFVVCPGYVHDKHDEDRHYMTGQMLIKAYGLDKKRTSIHRGFRKDNSPILEPEPPKEVELVYLHPRVEGDYKQPE